MAEAYSLKDDLYNADRVAYLGGLFAASDPAFDADAFQTRVMSKLLDLELKARIFWIRDCLGDVLPNDFEAACAAILAALPAPLDASLTDNDFGDFIFCPLGEFVALHGVDDHFDLSMQMLEALTQRFSMEWPVRPFLAALPSETLARMQGWTQHPSYHVRRLASEGSRPKLPWGQGIGLSPDQTVPILDALYADPTRYVTRSVANHLNDISKSDPELVVATLRRWRDSGDQNPKEMAWISKHALRGLIKAGHSGALELLGYRADASVSVTDLSFAPSTIAIDTAGVLTFTLLAAEDTPVLVDYVIDFLKANGSHAPKVSKLKQVVLKAGQPMVFSKKHMFKGGATTFTLYAGLHRLHIQVNGRQLAGTEFTLTSP